MSIRNRGICGIEILTDAFEIILIVIGNLEKNDLFSLLGIVGLCSSLRQNTEAVHSKKARKTVLTNKIQAMIRFLVAAG